MRTHAGCVILLVAALCCGQASNSSPSAPTTTYRSEAMNLEFRYPSAFTNKSADESAPSQDPAKGNPGKKICISVPITAMDMRKSFNMIFLRRSDGACLDREITAAERSRSAVSFLSDLLQQFGKPDMGSGTDYDVASHMASGVSGSVKVDDVKPAGTVIYGSGSCVSVDKDMACFAFLSSDCKALGTLSASTVKFTNSAEAPVIPAPMTPACR